LEAVTPSAVAGGIRPVSTSRLNLFTLSVIATHMSDEMLTKLPQLEVEAAEDGKRIIL
jgi:hypothetical protein